MCVLVFAWRVHPHYKLIFAGNRDEFYDRPAARASWWSGDAQLLAGRDLKAGGTWLGVTRKGRFAVVSNFRDPRDKAPRKRSRGELVPAFASSPNPPHQFLKEIQERGDEYAGFNLIFGDGQDLHYLSNRAKATSPLPPGIHGLSNHQLNTPWPKLERVREQFKNRLEESAPEVEDLLAPLAERWYPPLDRLADTGMEPGWERTLSSPFIVSPLYGTRCSTVVMVGYSGNAVFVERRFSRKGDLEDTRVFRFRIE